jgi:hypothetical protein
MCRQPGHPRQDNGPASGVSSSPACAVTRGPSGKMRDLHVRIYATGDKRRYEALKRCRKLKVALSLRYLSAGRREAAHTAVLLQYLKRNGRRLFGAPQSSYFVGLFWEPTSWACFGRTREISPLARLAQRDDDACLLSLRHGRACPGHPRLGTVCGDLTVDARNKSGHDESEESWPSGRWWIFYLVFSTRCQRVPPRYFGKITK